MTCLSSKGKLAAIILWQNNNLVHPMKCRNNTAHRPLIGIEERGHVMLRCPDCSYVQEKIPDPVVALYMRTKGADADITHCDSVGCNEPLNGDNRCPFFLEIPNSGPQVVFLCDGCRERAMPQKMPYSIGSTALPPPEEVKVNTSILDIIEDKASTRMALTDRFDERGEMDSLDYVEFIMAVEDDFDIEITDEMAESFKTPQDVSRFVLRHCDLRKL